MDPFNAIPEAPAFVSNPVHNTGPANKCGIIEKEGCRAARDDDSQETFISGQSDTFTMLHALGYVLAFLSLCCGLAIYISWILVVPVSIFFGSAMFIDLYLQQNDPMYYQVYA